ncbi:MAG: hypothetical protein B5M53_05210 [Candidatus Cloacimonas sp. 4484_209]|nr:MAG: hypothetical protein B5M53_05210 [Candidatus Cloacimonas sp. 4484_209]
MSEEEYLIETGKSIEDAIQKAIKKLKCTQEEIEVEILEEKRKRNIFGLRSPTVTVKVTVKNELSKIKLIIENILSLMKIQGEVFQKKEGSANIITIYTAGYDGLLIGRGGKTLDALQYIVSKIARKSGINIPFYITVGNYKRPYNKSKNELQ